MRLQANRGSADEVGLASGKGPGREQGIAASAPGVPYALPRPGRYGLLVPSRHRGTLPLGPLRVVLKRFAAGHPPRSNKWKAMACPQHHLQL